MRAKRFARRRPGTAGEGGDRAIVTTLISREIAKKISVNVAFLYSLNVFNFYRLWTPPYLHILTIPNL